MAYDFTIKEKAFELFCQGRAMKDIAQALGITRDSTLSNWRKKYNWDDRRKEIQAQAQAALDNSIAEDMAKRLRAHDAIGQVLRGLVATKLAAIQEKTKPTTDEQGRTIPGLAPDGLELMRLAATSHRAIQIERQALGLDTDGETGSAGAIKAETETKAALNLTVVADDVELIKRLAGIKEGGNGNGNGDGQG